LLSTVPDFHRKGRNPLATSANFLLCFIYLIPFLLFISYKNIL